METSTTDPTLLMLIGGIVVLLAGSVAYGVYSTFGSGSKELRDTIDEHAKMHELGIAHGPVSYTHLTLPTICSV